jgi:hypothetical protein
VMHSLMAFDSFNTRTIELRTVVVVPGSRLFSHVSAGLVTRRKLRGGWDTRQSGSPPGVANRFEDEDDRDNALNLPYEPFVRLNVIHIANDVIVLHLDRINLFGVTLDHSFASDISGNPQD